MSNKHVHPIFQSILASISLPEPQSDGERAEAQERGDLADQHHDERSERQGDLIAMFRREI